VSLGADRPDVLAEPPPAFASADAERLAKEVFGLDASATALGSERDQNFRLRVDDGREVVLKIANSAEDPAVLDFETRALLHVAARDPELPVPRVLATPSGRLSGHARAPDGRRHVLRLLSFVPGAPLGDARLAPPLLRDLGSACARLGHALRGFFHPAAGRELRWDLKHAARLREQLADVADPRARELADRALERFERRALPSLPDLRAQVIHNDVSRNNALADAARARIVGVIDFGDMVHAPLVHDLAVTLAEALLGEADPVAVAREVVGGYASREPLRDEERALLVDLVAARLAMGIAISAWRSHRFPENLEYIAGDDGPAAATLEQLERCERELHAALAPADSGERLALRRADADDERERTSRARS